MLFKGPLGYKIFSSRSRETLLFNSSWLGYFEPMDKSGFLLLAIFSGLFVGFAVFICSRLVFQNLPLSGMKTGSGADTTISTEDDPVTPGSAAEVVVEVAGAVQNPGLYELVASSRVGDVLTLAGGLTRDASASYFGSEINLAKKIKDEEKIYVPYIWDVANATKVSSSIEAIGVTSELSRLKTEGGLVDIDKASAEDLDALPGIGPAYAQRLVENRPYQDWNEVVTKSKVPEAVLEKIRSLTIYK
jgi:competence protein ComEA